ncbi:MAG: GGDEF domain-containing protein [Pseudomonadota bacterium]
MLVQRVDLPKPIRILLIHNQLEYIEPLIWELKTLSYAIELLQVPTIEAAQHLVADHVIHCVFIQTPLSEHQVQENFEWLARETPGVPVVLMIEESQINQVNDFIRQGMIDYLVDHIEWKKHSLQRVLRYMIAQQQNEEQISRLAHYDALTGVANRHLFRDRISQAVIRSQRSGKSIAILFIDLDHFHDINGTLGYDIGDRILNAFAKKLSKSVRRQDTIARLGGDEFAIVLENLNEAQDAGLIARQIIDHFLQPIDLPDRSVTITMSIGISTTTDGELDPNTLIKQADIARYRAKEKGSNTFEFYAAQLNQFEREREEITEQLHSELDRIFRQPPDDE